MSGRKKKTSLYVLLEFPLTDEWVGKTPSKPEMHRVAERVQSGDFDGLMHDGVTSQWPKVVQAARASVVGIIARDET